MISILEKCGRYFPLAIETKICHKEINCMINGLSVRVVGPSLWYCVGMKLRRGRRPGEFSFSLFVSLTYDVSIGKELWLLQPQALSRPQYTVITICPGNIHSNNWPCPAPASLLLMSRLPFTRLGPNHVTQAVMWSISLVLFWIQATWGIECHENDQSLLLQEVRSI